MVRDLRLADEEDELEVEGPVKAIPEPTPLVNVPAKESDVLIVEAPLVKRGS
jgi:hypothetical protein